MCERLREEVCWLCAMCWHGLCKTQKMRAMTLRCHVLSWVCKRLKDEATASWGLLIIMIIYLWTVKASGCFLFGDVENEMIDKIWSSFQTFLVHWHALMWLYTPSDRKVPGGREQLIKAATFEQTVPCSCAWVILRSQILWDFFRIFVKENNQRKFCVYQASQDKRIRSGLREAAEHNISGRGTKERRASLEL